MDAPENLSAPGMAFPDATAGQEMFTPLVPHSIQDLGLPPVFLSQLVLKHCFFMDVFTLGDLAERLKVSASIIDRVIDYLKREKYIEVRGPDPMARVVSSLSLAHRHALTDGGKRRAAQLLEYDAYAGPVPVTLAEYWRQVTSQKISLAGISPDHLQRSFQGLVLGPAIMEQLGVAAVSGKPLFLYGPPGNGKTAISLCLGEIWQDTVLAPYALYVAGQVIQVLDEMVHRQMEEPAPGTDRGDRRWVRCQRPTVVVGGELTLDMLDLAYKPNLRYYEAPLQLKANNGVFVVDDFGRQRLSCQELLNRWIIPLENRQDFLRLRTGQKFAIPFDQFIVFATNLEPKACWTTPSSGGCRSKVKVDYITRDQFVEIFVNCCEHYGVEFVPQAVEYLLSTYYDAGQRPLTACHPRGPPGADPGLLPLLPDPRLTPENLDRACRSYFVA